MASACVSDWVWGAKNGMTSPSALSCPPIIHPIAVTYCPGLWEHEGMHPRVLEVLNALSTGRVLRACDLAVRFNTSERTIRRDIADLREQGYRIDAAPGVGGGYVAPIGAVLPPLQFSPHEAFTIAMALRTLAGQGIPIATVRQHPSRRIMWNLRCVNWARCFLPGSLPS